MRNTSSEQPSVRPLVHAAVIGAHVIQLHAVLKNNTYVITNISLSMTLLPLRACSETGRTRPLYTDIADKGDPPSAVKSGRGSRRPQFASIR